jgi:4-hydroxy-tetrahydrodipicolinate synthase
MATVSASLSLAGNFTALVTPFLKDGSAVDKGSLERLVSWQLEAKVSGVVVCGSTGEASTLSDAEYLDVVSFVRALTKDKVPCVAGISVSATARAVEMARAVTEIGCDGILVATPPYNKPSQSGIIEHFRSVHAATVLPLVAYNVPGRTGVAIAPSTMGVLSKEGVVVGLKEASGSIDNLADVMVAVQPSCQVVSGDDSLALAAMAYGGVGVISASANALPREFVSLMAHYAAGRVDAAREIQLALLPKIRALFVEANPVPVKYALAQLGVIEFPTVRLPLSPLSTRSEEVVRGAFGL